MRLQKYFGISSCYLILGYTTSFEKLDIDRLCLKINHDFFRGHKKSSAVNSRTPKIDSLSLAASHVQVVTQNGYEKQAGLTSDSEKLSTTAAATGIKDRSTAEDVVNFAVANSYDAESFKRLPIGISLPILSCLYQVWLPTNF